MFIFIELSLIIIVVAVVVFFLYRPPKNTSVELNASNIAISKDKLGELESDYNNSLIDETNYLSAKEEIKLNLAAELSNEDNKKKFYNKHIVAIFSAVFIIVGSYLIYEQVKFEEKLSIDNVGAIKAHLKENPNDVKAYQMLGLAFNIEGKLDEAINAYAKAYELGSRENSLLTEYASLLATKNGGDFTGLPAKLVADAIKQDDKSVQALYLAGVIAANNSDLELAQNIWQRALALSTKDSEDFIMLSDTLKRLAEFLTQNNNQIIQVIVDIDPEIYKEFFTGFILVYAQEEQKPMPVAISKIPLSEFIGLVELSDDNSMMQTKKLSSLESVIIKARLSKTGGAIKQDGDIEVATNLVAVKNQVLELKIGE
jgi:cytochrome c-type biogenesis protein CcmH